ncbi:hypothetical protein [Lebetimonas sp. JH292]|uniref:hypothetical protein n=1 Tax=Lebetimonas sp. JH292 TaxID=990068 RepID=UPI000465E3F4|nr:hypothetical protein [Lebetimonas sp. JH292]
METEKTNEKNIEENPQNIQKEENIIIASDTDLLAQYLIIPEAKIAKSIKELSNLLNSNDIKNLI